MTLPSEIGQLTSLTELDLTCCSSLTSLPPEIGHFPMLQRLSLTGCKELCLLPPDLNLRKVEICGWATCPKLKEKYASCMMQSARDMEVALDAKREQSARDHAKYAELMPWWAPDE
jgi:hypothetical protein